MQRRRFLQVVGQASLGLGFGAGLGASAGLRVGPGLGPRTAPKADGPRRIAVVGAGIVGASVAYHLARRGADVVLVERTRPGAGTTGRTFGWINAHFSKKPRAYHLLSQMALAAYARLEHTLGQPGLVQWGGAVEWYTDANNAAMLRAEVKAMQEWGDAIRLVDAAELRKLEPNVEPGALTAASFAELEGGVDAVGVTEAMIRTATSLGARAVYPAEVTGMIFREGRLRALCTTTGEVPADCVVVACGVDTPRVAALAGLTVPLRDAPGILALTNPQPALVSRIVVAPGVHARQFADGRLLVGEDDGPPAGPTHAHLSTGPQDFPTDDFRALHGAALLRMGGKYLPALARAEVEETRLGWRPMPKDGWPIVGHAAANRDVYLAVTHSGITFGPLLGQLVATELLDGVVVDLLAPYRLERFA